MHTMTLINEHEGSEEWLCSSCGRHLLVNWFPNFTRTVLEPGELSAAHRGFRDNSQADDRLSVPVDKTYRSELPELPLAFEDPSLTPWIMWMDEVGFEGLWNRDDY
ncbi:MAG: hypothetical protein PVJ21_16340 [Anaerolineales bacterium]